MVPMQLLHTALHQPGTVEQTVRYDPLLGGGPVSDTLVDEVRELGTCVYDGYGHRDRDAHRAAQAERRWAEEYFTTLQAGTVRSDADGRLM